MQFFLVYLRRFLFSFLINFRAFFGRDSMELSGRSSLDDCFDASFDDIKNKIEFKKTDTIVDLGCSDGELFSKILPHIQKGILVDVSSKQLERAKQKMPVNNITFIKGDAAQFEQQPSTVDKVICYSVVHALKSYSDFENMLKNIYAMLKSGGKAIIGDVPLYDLQQKKGTKILIKLMGYLYVKYTEEEILDSSRKIGFKASVVSQSPELPYAKTRKDLILEKQ